MVSGSMAFAAINDQSVSQQPVNEPDTTYKAQPEEPDSTAQTPKFPLSQPLNNKRHHGLYFLIKNIWSAYSVTSMWFFYGKVDSH